MSGNNKVVQESWDFLVDLNQMPYNQKVSVSKLNLEMKRKVDEINKRIEFYFDRNHKMGRDIFIISVNNKEDADRIRGIVLEFKVRKGSPIQIKLEERKPRHDPDKWNQAVWVKCIGTYGHSYRGRGGNREVALNQEEDRNFDKVFSSYGEILRRTRTDRIIIDEEDENGKPIKVLGPKTATRSLKMIIYDNLNNPIPRDFKYESPTSSRAKMIRVMYDGQPWFCKPCGTHHLSRFCPDDKRDTGFQNRGGNYGNPLSRPVSTLKQSYCQHLRQS
jgi:hypothetical protein